VKRLKVKLIKPHEHGGVRYRTGDTIKLRPDQAQRLKAWGVAEELKDNKKREG